MTACRVMDVRPQETIAVTSFHEWVLPGGARWASFYRYEGAYLVRFWDLADFEVAGDGRDVCCWPTVAASPQTIEHLYINQVLPLALSRQRRLVFHASAVEAAGVALAFFGPSGRGKSTLAASFATNGSPFLNDDALLLVTQQDQVEVQPGQPFVRLWEDSQAVLVGGRATLGPTAQYSSKARVLADDAIAFCHETRPLGLAFFLGEGDGPDVSILPVDPSSALIELVKHSFLLDVEDRDVLAWHFGCLSLLASRCIWLRLDYPRRFEKLAQVRHAVLAHLKGASGM